MKNNYFAYLHSCWLSHNELTGIFWDWANNPKDFFESLSNSQLAKYIINVKRREGIVEKHKLIKTRDIDNVIEKLDVNIITLLDKSYPENLKNIPHTPFLLYVRGEILNIDMFWVVWSRKISEYGKSVIRNIVPDISQIFPIVSGWAAGCDSQAHKSALESWNKTVVVVGTWIDQTYPVSNEKLFNSIVDAWWAIVSIFRIWEPGNPYNFPVRNEVVVWLCRWILVVEAREKSWSLITAWLTLDLWKDLYSVPWDIFSSHYKWTNSLIKKWEAKCVTQVSDIMEEYNVEVKKKKHEKCLEFSDELEQMIYEHISSSSQSIDELSNTLHQDTRQLLSKLSLLELKWVINKDMLWKYKLA